MLPPLPRRGNGRHCIAHPSRRASLPRIGCRVGPRIVLFEACSAFTRIAACTLALPPNRGSLTRRLQPLRFLHSCSGASGWSSSPGGPLTHWKAPPYHGARQLQTVEVATENSGKRAYVFVFDPHATWQGARHRSARSSGPEPSLMITEATMLAASSLGSMAASGGCRGKSSPLPPVLLCFAPSRRNRSTSVEILCSRMPCTAQHICNYLILHAICSLAQHLLSPVVWSTHSPIQGEPK